MSKSLYMTDERYIAALKRKRAQIANGLPLSFEDDDTPGNKYTRASWGLCDDSPNFWTDEADMMFPERDKGQPIVSSKYRHEHQRCPMNKASQPHGCFYGCSIFKRKIRHNNQAEAIALFDSAITLASERLPNAIQS